MAEDNSKIGLAYVCKISLLFSEELQLELLRA